MKYISRLVGAVGLGVLSSVCSASAGDARGARDLQKYIEKHGVDASDGYSIGHRYVDTDTLLAINSDIIEYDLWIWKDPTLKKPKPHLNLTLTLHRNNGDKQLTRIRDNNVDGVIDSWMTDPDPKTPLGWIGTKEDHQLLYDRIINTFSHRKK